MPQRRYGKFHVWVYTRNERGHRPHVHVLASGGKISIYIDAPIEVRAIEDMTKADARKALEVVAEHADELLALWRRYNGENRTPDR
ncbi:MAG: DUF4160 domain-containing protein [Vulcanimicrobiaceae bacterium]